MADIIIAVQYLKRIAYDNTYGYSQPRRDEGKEGDCSSDLLDALRAAGFNTGAASYTGDMLNPLLAAGFVDVTSKINLRTGDGLILADVCLRPKTKNRNGHVVMCVGGGEIVQDQADYDGVRGDSSGREIRVQPYYDSPFKYVLRYPVVVTPVPAPADPESVLITGIGNSSSDGKGKATSNGIGKVGKIIKIIAGAKCPYGINYTSNTWIDAWFPAASIKLTEDEPVLFAFINTVEEMNIRSAPKMGDNIVEKAPLNSRLGIVELSGSWGRIEKSNPARWINVAPIWGRRE